MGVLNSFLPRGWGIRPSKKSPGAFAWGGWSGLELTDTLMDNSKIKKKLFVSCD